MTFRITFETYSTTDRHDNSPETESVEVEAEPELDRDEAEANYQKALNERNAQLTKCLATQNKLADYFKRKKTDEEKKKPSDEETNDLGKGSFFVFG